MSESWNINGLLIPEDKVITVHMRSGKQFSGVVVAVNEGEKIFLEQRGAISLTRKYSLNAQSIEAIEMLNNEND